MSEHNLKKEFSKRDVQRMRNLITGDANGATGTQTGYTKQHIEYKEGDVWEDNGKKWTIKNGIKQTVTKFDKLKQLIIMPITCPKCSQPMKLHYLNKKMWSIHSMCLNCVIKMEAEIKRTGKWEEYEKQIMNNNKNAMVDDFEEAFNNFMNTKAESYVTEQGDIESWSGGKVNEDEIKNVKEYIKKLREHEL
jgi:hypothetical protein